MSFRLTFFCSFALILLTCKPKLSQPTPGLISVADARHLVKNYNPIIVDVRTPKEVEMGAITGALFINMNDVAFTARIAQLDTSKTYLVYCKKGGRSARAVNMMHNMGFSKVYDMDGGYDKWLRTK